MSTVTALGGWVLAAVAAGGLLLARRVAQARTQAIARACHELRGPLTAARLGLSCGSGGGALPAGRLRAIDAELGRAALALEDLTRARAGEIPLRAPGVLDLRALAADSVEAWRASAEAAGAALHGPEPGEPVAVRGDRLRLAQAVGNLLANAIEHGAAAGGTVEVHVGGRGRVARVEVQDDGRGLPATVAELAARPPRAGGARGHGLAIAAAVTRAHGGRLASAPAPRGARLVLELPLTGGDRPGA